MLERPGTDRDAKQTETSGANRDPEVIDPAGIEIGFSRKVNDFARDNDKLVCPKGEIVRLFSRRSSGSHQNGSLARPSWPGERLFGVENNPADNRRNGGDEGSGQEDGQVIHGSLGDLLRMTPSRSGFRAVPATGLTGRGGTNVAPPIAGRRFGSALQRDSEVRHDRALLPLEVVQQHQRMRLHARRLRPGKTPPRRQLAIAERFLFRLW